MTFNVNKDKVNTSILNIKKGSLLSKAYTAQRRQDWKSSETLQRYKAIQQRKNRFHQGQLAGGQVPARTIKKINFAQHHYEAQVPNGNHDVDSLSAANAGSKGQAGFERESAVGEQLVVGYPAFTAYGQRGSQVSTAQPGSRPTQHFPGAKLGGSSSQKKLIFDHHHQVKQPSHTDNMTASFFTSKETLTGTALSPPVARGSRLPADQSKAKIQSPALGSRMSQGGRQYAVALTPDRHHL